MHAVCSDVAAACSMQHAACGVRRGGVRHVAASSGWRAMCAACSVQRAACRAQRDAQSTSCGDTILDSGGVFAGSGWQQLRWQLQQRGRWRRQENLSPFACTDSAKQSPSLEPSSTPSRPARVVMRAGEGEEEASAPPAAGQPRSTYYRICNIVTRAYGPYHNRKPPFSLISGAPHGPMVLRNLPQPLPPSEIVITPGSRYA